jgi:hypothetical protein
MVSPYKNEVVTFNVNSFLKEYQFNTLNSFTPFFYT